ncbi:hypothetical protein ACOME3_002367 [Neoechinorhynchus agilis]
MFVAFHCRAVGKSSGRGRSSASRGSGRSHHATKSSSSNGGAKSNRHGFGGKSSKMANKRSSISSTPTRSVGIKAKMDFKAGVEVHVRHH